MEIGEVLSQEVLPVTLFYILAPTQLLHGGYPFYKHFLSARDIVEAAGA